MFKVFDITEFVGEYRWVNTLIILLSYGFAHIPQTYIFAYKFKISSSGFAVITAWNIISSKIKFML